RSDCSPAGVDSVLKVPKSTFDPHIYRGVVVNIVMRQQPTPAAESRQVEPEIIRPSDRDTYSERVWIASGRDRVVHVRIARPGPLGVVIALLLIGAALAGPLL